MRSSPWLVLTISLLINNKRGASQPTAPTPSPTALYRARMKVRSRVVLRLRGSSTSAFSTKEELIFRKGMVLGLPGFNCVASLAGLLATPTCQASRVEA